MCWSPRWRPSRSRSGCRNHNRRRWTPSNGHAHSDVRPPAVHCAPDCHERESDQQRCFTHLCTPW
jgi:hypothetical protein